MAKLIGLGGYAGVGKDAFADVLVQHGWYKTYMSKKLRESLEVLNPLIKIDRETGLVYRFADVVKFKGYEGAKKHPEVRRLLQLLGTEVGRNMFGKNFWVDLCLKEVDDIMSSEENVVITGIRYQNELDCYSRSGRKTIWVYRPGYSPVNDHSSDNSLGEEDFDVLFSNNGDLIDLARAVPRFISD